MPELDQKTLHIKWQTSLTVLSLRGEGTEIAAGVQRALGVELPLNPNTTNPNTPNPNTTNPNTTNPNPPHAHGDVRLVWVSPDDFFVLAPPAQAPRLEAALRDALAGQHCAVTDVSSGYHLLSLAGTAARSMLAQGCPLDLDPRSFGLGQCAGSHFFKASLWLWLASDEPRFELLVRRSFAPYVDNLLSKASLDCDVQRSGGEIETHV